jgi:hypothetical protein
MKNDLNGHKLIYKGFTISKIHEMGIISVLNNVAKVSVAKVSFWDRN